jgi:hypothetical protein
MKKIALLLITTSLVFLFAANTDSKSQSTTDLANSTPTNHPIQPPVG